MHYEVGKDSVTLSWRGYIEIKTDAYRWRYFRDEMDQSDILHMIASGSDHYDVEIDRDLARHYPGKHMRKNRIDEFDTPELKEAYQAGWCRGASGFNPNPLPDPNLSREELQKYVAEQIGYIDGLIEYKAKQ